MIWYNYTLKKDFLVIFQNNFQRIIHKDYQKIKDKIPQFFEEDVVERVLCPNIINIQKKRREILIRIKINDLKQIGKKNEKLYRNQICF